MNAERPCPHHDGPRLEVDRIEHIRCHATFCPHCRVWIRRSDDHPEPRPVNAPSR